jgi:hypothetical protein
MLNWLMKLSSRKFHMDGISLWRSPSTRRPGRGFDRAFAKSDQIKTVLVLAAAWAFVICGCQTPSKPLPRQFVLGWRPVASWSGHANYQTDSFDIRTGQWRIKWETRDQTSSGKGTFRVIVHSSVSGRPVIVAVDYQGAGQGVGYVAEDPREFFLVVESTGLDWNIGVDEGSDKQ